MNDFLLVAGATLGAMLAGAGVLHALPRLGRPGRAISRAVCRVPTLDLAITYFTIAPLIAGPVYAGWPGLAGAAAGQVSGVLLWGWAHELRHWRTVRRGPRIVTTLNAMVGRVRNHAAVWLTAIVTPLFWVVRLAQLFVYPPITWLVGLPKYRQGDWVNVSRQKFAGLVGHDRIWCLYCDWMTGVWSLGSEMLRNVESFWCPIRFASGVKCDHCAIDFPDVARGWVPADGSMGEVAALLKDRYGGRRERPWFGHPARLTVGGRAPAGAPIVEVRPRSPARAP